MALTQLKSSRILRQIHTIVVLGLFLLFPRCLLVYPRHAIHGQLPMAPIYRISALKAVAAGAFYRRLASSSQLSPASADR
jgi:hypothetical protein